MQYPISVSISFPYLTAYFATLQIILRSPLQLVFSAVFPIAGLCLIYLWVTLHHTWEFTDIALLASCFFFTPLITAFTLFLARRRNPLSKGPFIYSFDEERIYVAGEAFDMSIKWTAIQRVVESGHFIFFFVAPSRAHSLPLAQLRVAGCLDAIRTLAHSKVGNSHSAVTVE